MSMDEKKLMQEEAPIQPMCMCGVFQISLRLRKLTHSEMVQEHTAPLCP